MSVFELHFMLKQIDMGQNPHEGNRLKWNSPSVTDTFIATQNFMYLISFDISMKIHTKAALC